MHAEWTNPKGEVLKSSVVTPTDAGWLGLELLFNESDIEQNAETETNSNNDSDDSEVANATVDGDHEAAEQTVLDFRDDYEYAVNNKDFSSISPYLEKDSTAEKGLKKYISDLKDTDYDYNFTSNKILDTKVIDDHTIQVKTNELFTFTNHLDQVTDYDREKLYTLTQEQGDYYITEIEYLETNRD